MFVDHTKTLDAEMDSFWPSEAARIRSKPAAGKRAAPELRFQRAAIRYLRQLLPLGSIVAATNTERRGSGRTPEERARFGAALKASGVLPGFFDTIALTVGPLAILFEWKAPGGVLSASQREVHAAARALGFVVIVARSLEEIRDGLREAGIRTREHA